MSDHPPIQEALNAVKSAVGAVGKTGFNQQQSYNFRGVDAVVNAAAPHLNEHGIIPLPTVLSKVSDSFTTRNGAVMHTMLVEVQYEFVGPAGDSLKASVYGEAADAGDKATPKAMSVAYRTALLQVLNLPTDEPDPDEQTYERVENTQESPPETDWAALGWKDQADHDSTKAAIKAEAASLSEDSKEALKSWADGRVTRIMSSDAMDEFAAQVKALAAGDPPSQEPT